MSQPSRSGKEPSMARFSAIIFVFLLCAKLLNFFKKILIGHLFGVGDTADAFFAASYLPYYLSIFFEGAIFLVFLPAFASVRSQYGETGERRFVSQMAGVLLVLCLVCVAGMNFFGTEIVAQLVPGFKAAKMMLTLPLLRILSLVVLFISLCTLFQALNSYHRHYLISASSGFMDTAFMIGFTVLSFKAWGIYGAAWGSVAGAFIAFMAQAVYYLRRHGVAWGSVISKAGALSALIYAMVPLAVVWGFQQVPMLVISRFGSGMWRGTISALNIAQTLTTVPMGLVSRTVLLSIFPFLVKQAHEDSPQAASHTFFQTLRVAFVFLLPAGILLSAFAKPIAVIFFSGAGIDPEGSRRIAHSLVWFGWSLFLLYADLFASQTLVAMRAVRAAILIGVARAVLNYAIAYVLTTALDYQGIALGFSLALTVNFFLFFPVCFRISGIHGPWFSLHAHIAKLTLASVPVLFAVLFLNRIEMTVWLAWPRLLSVAVLTGGSAFLIVLSFGLMLLMKLPEADQILNFIKVRKQPALTDFEPPVVV